MKAQVPARRASCCRRRSATAVRVSQSLDQRERARERASWARGRGWERAAAAGPEADMRPRWQTKAATKRRSRAAVAAVRRAGRRKVLKWGRVSAKITGGLLPRQRTLVAQRHSTG